MQVVVNNLAPVAPAAPIAEIKVILPGTKLYARSIGDWDCIYEIEILSRSNKTVKVKMRQGEIARCKIYTSREGIEYVKAFGNYSMAPMFMANKLKP